MTNNQTFILSNGETTINTTAMIAKQGDYNIAASFARRDDGEYQSINITVSFGGFTATLNQYGASQNINYSLPVNVSQAQEAELRVIFAESLKQIKAR